ncbi:hypothetical protein [Burkholderia pseudomallei]|uniref:hypothetical protein n=1 Tax=Burkholderia pseudomallei TaxID=28450 RepID=UPI000AD1AA1B|nr:hypothetical protein [Burkholderia pseudomallei]
MSQIVIFERLRNVVDKHDIERNFALMRQRSNIRRSVDGTCRAKTGVNVMGSISRRVRLARRARMAPIGRAVQFLCSPFDWSGSGKPVRASAAVTVLPRPEPRLSTSIERSNVSTRAPRFIRFGHGAPASPIVQYLHRGALRTAEKISRRSEDQIIPIIDPPDQYAAASLAQAYLSDNDYRPPPDAPATHDDLHSALVSARHARMPTTNVNVPSCLKLQRFETIFQIPALSRTINGNGIGPISQPLFQLPACLPNLGV